MIFLSAINELIGQYKNVDHGSCLNQNDIACNYLYCLKIGRDVKLILLAFIIQVE